MKNWQVVVIVTVAVVIGTGANVWYTRRASINVTRHIREVSSEKEKSFSQRLERLDESLTASVSATASDTVQIVNARLNDVGSSLAAQIQSASSNTTAETAKRLEALERSLNARLLALEGKKTVSTSQLRANEWPTEWRILFQDNFKGPLTWTVSNSSVHIKDNDFLVIDSDGHNDDWAEKDLSVSLSSERPVIIEQRLKLQSGGMNYRLPHETISFEDSSTITATYLPNFPGIESQPPYGWGFGGWTGNHDHAVPGSGYWTSSTADYWALTRIVITPTEGVLYVKPDDREKGWFSDQFYQVASRKWSHSRIEKIRFSQPWDSVCYIDYIKIGYAATAQ